MISVLELRYWLIIIFQISYYGNVTAQELNQNSNDPAVILPGKDSVFRNPVFLTTENSGFYYYSCMLNTPVCNDTLCQIVRLNIQWDLIGNYIRFDTLNGFPLTKNDHLPFTESDYERLHQTLLDKNSVLGRTSEGDLLEKGKTRYSEKIDGITGATSILIKKSVVEGAMYSTYTVWHLINGPIRQKLKDYTIQNYDPEIEQQLIHSGNPHMMITALKQWKNDHYAERFDELISIMSSGNPLVNFFIIKHIPEEVLSKKENQDALKNIWDILDPNTKSILINYIEPD